MTYDAIIVGTGPSGVSAAFPLAEAGLSVLIIDAGSDDAPTPPAGEYLSLRRHDANQWDWMIGRAQQALRGNDRTSPKLRVPSLAATFAQFSELNSIHTDNFACAGSLASGGLSNAWGSGVARFDAGELRSFPLAPTDLDAGFEAVANRIGISGRSDDDLSAYFGIDAFAGAPVDLDAACATVFDRYRRRGGGPTLRLGRARLALLTRDHNGRATCDSSGLCLWGCHRRAIYSARYDLDALKRHPNLLHMTGVVARRLERNGSEWILHAVERSDGTPRRLSAKSVVLAAGTIATTAIALRSLGQVGRSVRLLSNPTAAFILILPERIGLGVARGHNMGQLVASIDGVSEFGNIYCGMFAASHLPAREFITRLPLGRATGIDLWRMLMSAVVVGNCFLPGAHSEHTMTLQADGNVLISGGENANLAPTLQKLRKELARSFRKLGAILPPGGFLPGLPGSDIHYAGTLPMLGDGGPATTRPSGELVGLPGVYVADAASFPVLPAKPHTLTMMANAHRIGVGLARQNG